MKYYVFNLPLEAAQIRKMKEAWDECIGPGQPGSGLFCTVSFKNGMIRGMIMPPDVREKIMPTINGVLAAAEKDDLGNI